MSRVHGIPGLCRVAAALAVVWLGTGSPALAAPAFRLAGAMTEAEQVASAQLLDQAGSLLPPSWTAALDRPIDVTWRDDLPDGVHGRATGWRIALRGELLHAWMARDRGAGIADPGARKALAATIHELAHLYDNTPQGRLSDDRRLLHLVMNQCDPALPVDQVLAPLAHLFGRELLVCEDALCLQIA